MTARPILPGTDAEAVLRAIGGTGSRLEYLFSLWLRSWYLYLDAGSGETIELCGTFHRTKSYWPDKEEYGLSVSVVSGGREWSSGDIPIVVERYGFNPALFVQCLVGDCVCCDHYPEQYSRPSASFDEEQHALVISRETDGCCLAGDFRLVIVADDGLLTVSFVERDDYNPVTRKPLAEPKFTLLGSTPPFAPATVPRTGRRVP
jgi:hypothetical protein